MPRINRYFSSYLLSLLLPVVLLTFSGCSHPQTEESAVEAAAPEGSLYARLGGQEGVRNFADQFVRQLALNNKIMSNPLIAGALSKNQDNHKEKLATLLCQISGGACKYEERSGSKALKDAHAPLKISQAEWKEMTRIFIQTLQRLNVQKKERQELARLVARYKGQIVTP